MRSNVSLRNKEINLKRNAQLHSRASSTPSATRGATVVAAGGVGVSAVVGGNGGPIPAVGSGSRPARVDAVPVPVQGGIVVGVALRPEEVAEHASEVGDVGLGLELEGAAVGEVLGKLGGAALAEGGDGNGLLLLHNELVLLGGRLGLEALPWESALEEVD